MSDILIKGMKMPTCCYKCPMRRRDGMDLVCTIAHERFSVADINILEYRLDNCPLVPVPPHGRLIDADVLFKEIGMDGRFGVLEAMYIQSIIHDAPTIIPGDKED